MSRPRKPTKQLEAAGAFRHNPSRGAARANEPHPSGKLGDPPAWLDSLATQCWHDLVARVPYQLTNADEHILALTARLESRVRREIAIAAEINQYRACLQQLGMTPASRSNITVPAESTGNAFADA
jgi:phage terminase small subunit